MGDAGDRAVELAEERVEKERAAGVARIQEALRHDGRPTRLVCDCGNEIPEARRAAVPGTDRCFDCATFEERQARRRA